MKSDNTSIRRALFPYLVVGVGKDEWRLINRNHVPVGLNTRNWVDRKSDFVVSVSTKISQKTLENLSFDGTIHKTEDGYDYIMLYNDGCQPDCGKKHMDQYLEKLRVLINLEKIY